MVYVSFTYNHCLFVWLQVLLWQTKGQLQLYFHEALGLSPYNNRRNLVETTIHFRWYLLMCLLWIVYTWVRCIFTSLAPHFWYRLPSPRLIPSQIINLPLYRSPALHYLPSLLSLFHFTHPQRRLCPQPQTSFSPTSLSHPANRYTIIFLTH